MRRAPLLLGVGVLAVLVARALRPRHAPLDVAPRLDLTRYLGRWYEIARVPSWFERGCGQGDATYQLRDATTIDVCNGCTTRRGRREVHGVARVIDPAVPARLQVSFRRPFWGDYHVLHVDDDYRHAVVGEPSRRRAWILSRRCEVDDATWARLTDVLARQGFDVDRLVRLRPEPPSTLTEDELVTEAGLESFPASDPPSFTPGRA